MPLWLSVPISSLRCSEQDSAEKPTLGVIYSLDYMPLIIYRLFLILII